MPAARRQMHCKPSVWEISLCESRFLTLLLFYCCLAPIKRPYPGPTPLLSSSLLSSPRPLHQPGLRAYNTMLPFACSIKVHPLSILETAPLCCRMCGRSVCCASAARALPKPLADYYPGPKYTTHQRKKKVVWLNRPVIPCDKRHARPCSTLLLHDTYVSINTFLNPHKQPASFLLSVFRSIPPPPVFHPSPISQTHRHPEHLGIELPLLQPSLPCPSLCCPARSTCHLGLMLLYVLLRQDGTCFFVCFEMCLLTVLVAVGYAVAFYALLE